MHIISRAYLLLSEIIGLIRNLSHIYSSNSAVFSHISVCIDLSIASSWSLAVSSPPSGTGFVFHGGNEQGATVCWLGRKHWDVFYLESMTGRMDIVRSIINPLLKKWRIIL